jgi:putative hydrolase of the HAD superfamily
VILLDLDDTLIVEQDHAFALLRATASICGAEPGGWDEHIVETARSFWYSSRTHPVCKELGISSWEALWATFEGGHPSLAGLNEYAPTYRSRVWTSVLERAGLDVSFADEMERFYMDGQRGGHPLAEGAIDLVERATEIAPVVLVTNGPSDIQRLKIEQTGLADRFGAIVISGELGIGKPSAGIFHHAMKAAGVEGAENDPSRAVMVGDSWERDVIGAISAGIRAIWISHGSALPEPECPSSVDVAERTVDVTSLLVKADSDGIG